MIPVFLSSDNNYAPFIGTAVSSICDNTKSFINFYVLNSGITQRNQDKIKSLKEKFGNFSIEFIKIDTEKKFANINQKKYFHISLSTYNRLLIPHLKPDLEKVLYLDTDIIALGDIANLYNIDIENYALGAAWDKSRIMYNTDTFELMELSKNYKYFNAGVLLIDIKKWNNDNILNKLFEIEEKYKNKILHVDETLLNKYFDNNYKIFDIKYNYTDYDVANTPHKKPVIRHFATPMKPWNANYSIFNKKIRPMQNFDDFWKYASLTPFYHTIKEIYNKNINSNIFTKRMSKIVTQIKKDNP